MKKDLIPKILLILYVILFIITSIKPFDRTTWFIENLPVFIVVVLLVVTYKKFKFSNFSYVLMSLWIYMHTIGGYYTFERVPFDVVTDFFGFARNHYDRLAHFIIGFYAVPIAEYVTRKNIIVKWKYSVLFGLFAVAFIAAGYEIIEFAYAVIFGGDSAQNFLGSQGDFWDAQWDMLMDISGAVLSLIIFSFLRFRNKFISNN
jgi:putative membrane protein